MKDLICNIRLFEKYCPILEEAFNSDTIILISVLIRQDTILELLHISLIELEGYLYLHNKSLKVLMLRKL